MHSSPVTCLSLDPCSPRLLTGSDTIHMWNMTASSRRSSDYLAPPVDLEEAGAEVLSGSWELSWVMMCALWALRCAFRLLTVTRRMPNRVGFLKFSPDGRLFASVGVCDRLVKVWFRQDASVSEDGVPSLPVSLSLPVALW
jgi:WD40 repeat protein